MMKASETLVDCLTNLERVLTTPIPFSYSAHLWFVTTIYCMALVRKFINWIGFSFSGDQLGQLIKPCCTAIPIMEDTGVDHNPGDCHCGG